MEIRADRRDVWSIGTTGNGDGREFARGRTEWSVGRELAIVRRPGAAGAFRTILPATAGNGTDHPYGRRPVRRVDSEQWTAPSSYRAVVRWLGGERTRWG